MNNNLFVCISRIKKNKGINTREIYEILRKNNIQISKVLLSNRHFEIISLADAEKTFDIKIK